MIVMFRNQAIAETMAPSHHPMRTNHRMRMMMLGALG